MPPRRPVVSVSGPFGLGKQEIELPAIAELLPGQEIDFTTTLEDVPALAVKAYLVTYDFSLKTTEDSLRRFARSLCQNFSTLQEKGHPKWREVEIALPDLGRGWAYYPAAASELRACVAARAKPKAPPPRACTQQEQILGLCK